MIPVTIFEDLVRAQPRELLENLYAAWNGMDVLDLWPSEIAAAQALRRSQRLLLELGGDPGTDFRAGLAQRRLDFPSGGSLVIFGLAEVAHGLTRGMRLDRIDLCPGVSGRVLDELQPCLRAGGLFVGVRLL